MARAVLKHHLSESGFTLIELMVSMTLGIVLMLGVTTVVVNSSRSYNELTKASQHIENGRYAAEILTDDIRHAGFYGEFYRLPDPPAILPNPCDTTVTNLWPASGAPSNSPLSLPIQGYDFDIGDMTATPSPLSTCISDRVPGTDVLVIRRAGTVTVPADADENSPISLPTLTANQIYLQSTATELRLSTGSNTSIINLTRPQGSNPTTPIPAFVRRFEVHIYYVRSWSNTAGDGIPTLCRTELIAGSSGPAMTTVPLVQGIENLQIEYGIDRTDDGSPDADSSALGGTDIYEKNPADTIAWTNVMAVRFYLLVRSMEPSTGYQDSGKTYNLGMSGNITGSGSFKRHVFSTVVRLNNLSMRREVPL